MAFILKSLVQNLIPPTQNGETYSFPYQGDPITTYGGESLNIPMGYVANSLPPNTIFQLTPHDDMISSGYTSTTKHVHSSNLGSSISHVFHRNNRQQPHVLQKGMNIFNGILKNVSDVALSILPFTHSKQIQSVSKYTKAKRIKKNKINKSVFN